MVKRAKIDSPRRGGRPSKQDAERLQDKILDAASALFFKDGYGVTSIEAIARKAGISKRTFYHRFQGKDDIFKAVVHRVIESLRPKQSHPIFETKNLDITLLELAKVLLRAALTPQSLALYRTVLAKSARFPELALIMNREGARAEAITWIASLLQKENPALPTAQTVFAAEQFLQLIVSAPQRRALGLGKPMTSIEMETWAQNSVRLFLKGYLD